MDALCAIGLRDSVVCTFLGSYGLLNGSFIPLSCLIIASSNTVKLIAYPALELGSCHVAAGPLAFYFDVFQVATLIIVKS